MREFIKRIMEVDVDGLRNINRYTIIALYNEIHEDERGKWSTTESEIVDELTLSWADIDNDFGGVGSCNEMLRKMYHVEA